MSRRSAGGAKADSLRSRLAPEPELRLASHPSRVCEGRAVGRRRLAQGRAATDLSAEARREGESAKADVAQLAERVLGKDEVTSSILVIGSRMVESERFQASGASTKW